MKQYIGLDAHSSTSTFCVINEEGKEIDTTTIETNGRLLVNYIKTISGLKVLTFEECELSSWLFEILKNEVDELIVCNPRVNRSTHGAKTDIIDARKLAQLLRGGFLTKVYHDGSDREKFRSIVSAYQDIVDEAVRFKNRYKSLFRKEGNRFVGQGLYNDESLLNDFKRSDFKFIANETYTLLEKMEKSRQAYVNEIKKYNQKFKEIKYLKSLPGIGDIQAAKIVSQVITPVRFANKYKYYSYCGLVRHNRISGDKMYGSKKIWGNRILKCVYKMAGHSALRGDNAFKKYYDYLRGKGVDHKNAYNAVCRKIAAISLSLWKNSVKYDDKLLTNNIPK